MRRALCFMGHSMVMDQSIVEDCFRKAIQKYGVPEAVYFDNGKQYRTKWMTRTCSKLGIRLLFAKPYSPESTGKVERFNGVVQGFLNEVALEKPKTLERLNTWFQAWLSECYQNKPHSALGKYKPGNGLSKRPEGPSLRGSGSAGECLPAFRGTKSRQVWMHQLHGQRNMRWASPSSAERYKSCTILADITELTIEYEGHTPWKARELVIGERCRKATETARALATCSLLNPPVCCEQQSKNKRNEKSVKLPPSPTERFARR